MHVAEVRSCRSCAIPRTEPAIAAVGQIPATGTAIHNSLGLPFPARWETVRVIWWAAGGPDGKRVRGCAGPELAGCRAGLTAATRGAYRLLAR